MIIKHVVSVSGGKDSAATLLLALDRCLRENVIAIFCDTGNEHQDVYEYLNYLEHALDIKIHRLKADFSNEIMAKRAFIAKDRRVGRTYDTVPVFEADGKTPVFKRDGYGQIVMRKVRKGGLTVEEPVQKTKKVGGGYRIRWTNKAKRRALANLYSTGIPFLDLCMWKGRFPSRKAQFCTEELKTNIAVSFQIELMDQGFNVVSWQGVRRDESHTRRNAKLMERIAPKLWAFRPLVEWTALDVFSFCAEKKIKPNPLYLHGMTRVGCMPCINVKKHELKQIGMRFPEVITEKAEWEKKVAMCSKLGLSTFFTARGMSNHDISKQNINVIMEWAQTSRGGRQFNFFDQWEESKTCSSAYGLCA